MKEDGKSIFDALEELRKHMDESDPLKQKGIGEDWVCCMSSQTRADLERQINAKDPLPYPGFVTSIDRVSALVRRRIFIFDDLVYGRLEYMPFQQALIRDLTLTLQMRQASGGGELTRIDDDEGEVQS